MLLHATPMHGRRHMKMGMCCPPGMGGPMHGFFSKRRMIRQLEAYLDQLKEEIEDVEEYIAELKKEK